MLQHASVELLVACSSFVQLHPRQSLSKPWMFSYTTGRTEKPHTRTPADIGDRVFACAGDTLSKAYLFAAGHRFIRKRRVTMCVLLRLVALAQSPCKPERFVLQQHRKHLIRVATTHDVGLCGLKTFWILRLCARHYFGHWEQQ